MKMHYYLILLASFVTSCDSGKNDDLLKEMNEVLERQEIQSRAKLTVRAHAFQFGWVFQYPGPDGVLGANLSEVDNVFQDVLDFQPKLDPADENGADDFFSTELQLPRSTAVVIETLSHDVIHSFEQDALNLQADCLPMHVLPNIAFKTPDEPETLQIRCGIPCGEGHNDHVASLIILTKADYAKWCDGESPSPLN